MVFFFFFKQKISKINELKHFENYFFRSWVGFWLVVSSNSTQSNDNKYKLILLHLFKYFLLIYIGCGGQKLELLR